MRTEIHLTAEHVDRFFGLVRNTPDRPYRNPHDHPVETKDRDGEHLEFIGYRVGTRFMSDLDHERFGNEWEVEQRLNAEMRREP